MTRARILTIAGSDSGGGAGIQADLKTFTAHDCYGMSVLTAITAQNTQGVLSIMQCPPSIVRDQLDAVLSDIGCDAAKTGMLGNAEIVAVVSERLNHFRITNLVVDPVMVSKSGHKLLQPVAMEALKKLLLPLAAVATPNLEEAAVLLGTSPARSLEEMAEAARGFAQFGSRAVLVKGGHLPEQQDATDVLWDGTEMHYFRSPRVSQKHTHGTGCTLSSAIAANLGRGMPMIEAVRQAKEYLQEAITRAYPVGAGIGPVNHLWRTEGPPEDFSLHTQETTVGRPALKKGAIERSALELFVEKGVDGTSIRDIAQRAGVTEGALYRHHKSKDDLVRHLFSESYSGFGDITKDLLKDPVPFKAGLSRLINALFALYDQDPYIFQFVMVSRHKLLEDARAEDRNPVELMHQLINAAIKNGEIPRQNAELTTQLILGMVTQTAVGLHDGRIKGTLSSHADAVAKYCVALCQTPVSTS